MSAAQIGALSSPSPQPAPPSTPAVLPPATCPAAASASPPVSDPQHSADKEQLHEAMKKIEQVMLPSAQDLRFSIDEDTGITVVKLIDTQTQTVLRQIPTVEVIEISKALDKLQGLLVKDKA